MMADSNEILCFACRFGWGYAGNLPQSDDCESRVLPVLCCGKIETEYVLEALRQGIAGVLILACGENDCHFQDGVVQCYKRLLLLQEILPAFKMAPQRLKMIFGCDPEGASIAGHLLAFRNELLELAEREADSKQVDYEG